MDIIVNNVNTNNMQKLKKLRGVNILYKSVQKTISGGCAYKGCGLCRYSTNGTFCNTATSFGCCLDGICVQEDSRICR